MRVQVILEPAVAEVTVAGLAVAAHLTTVIARAVPESADGILVIDGRFAGVSEGAITQLSGLGAPARLIAGDSLVAELRTARDAPAPSDAPAIHLAADAVVPLTDPGALGRLEAKVRAEVVAGWIARGVHFVDPARVVVDQTVRMGAGCVVWPNVVLRGDTSLGERVEVQSGVWLEDTTVGDRTLIKPHSVCNGATIGPECAVGPMAHLRPGATLSRDVKVGNFVEVKKSVLHEGVRASHLTYLGDAEVGAGANIGAGTITCNYDGFRKHRTQIGAGAFIGSNTSLVAPVKVGDGAVVGASSAIARNIDAGALAVERAEVRVLQGKGAALMQRNARLAKKK